MVYTSEKDKRLNSIRDCDPICKPSSALDKSTQRGKPLVVSRANPNFCAFCGERHATISCSALDPVSEDTPSITLSNPPSKCTNCITIDRTTTVTVLDGVQQTITQSKIQLCSKHLVPDTAPPLPELDIATEVILDSLSTDTDPLNVINSPPHPATGPFLAPIPDPLPSPPPVPTAASTTGPIRHKKGKQAGRDKLETEIHGQYSLVLISVNSGMSINKAVRGIGMSRTSFYKYRWMAEMKIIDRNYYERLQEQFISTGKLPEECKAALNGEELFTAKGTQMRQNKELLPLF